MRIVADENIPYIREACAASLGEATLLSGRAIGPDDVRHADVLFVRSVTRVNAALLGGSSVRFVATATIGTDHVDLDYLRERGIGFAAAPGSNATSVAEYIVAALLCLARRRKQSLADMTLGVVGVGNVGRRVVDRARALGMNVICNDPPRARAEGDAGFVSLEALLQAADAITVHVPLTRQGPDATHHLIDEAFLRRMRPEGWLLNTSRGAVHDTQALLAHSPEALALDVWENEPNIDTDLLRRADLATPHIAGYSFDGKVAGTVMIHRAACAFLDIEAGWNPAPLLPEPLLPHVALDTTDVQGGLSALVCRAYDIEDDDARMRELTHLPQDERAAAFDQLRKTYPIRREFHTTRVEVRGEDAPNVRATLRALGFAAE